MSLLLPPPQSGQDAEQLVLQRLSLRLSRLESLISSRRSSSETGSSSSSLSSSLSKPRNLWKQVMQTAEKLGETVNRMGEAVLLHQLEKELLSSKDISGPAALRASGPSEKEAMVLSREGELAGIMSQLRAVEELKAFVNGPFLQDAEALRGSLSQHEAAYMGLERQTRALAHEMDELLTAYDHVVSMLSVKSVEWDEALRRLEAAS